MKELGSIRNPCKNNYDIDKIIIGMLNCKIYTLNTFEISEENLQQAKARNIIFVGLATAYWEKSLQPRIQTNAKKLENITPIGIEKGISIPVDLDKIAEQITQQFNINKTVFEEQFSKSADQIKTKYLGR